MRGSEQLAFWVWISEQKTGSRSNQEAPSIWIVLKALVWGESPRVARAQGLPQQPPCRMEMSNSEERDEVGALREEFSVGPDSWYQGHRNHHCCNYVNVTFLTENPGKCLQAIKDQIFFLKPENGINVWKTLKKKKTTNILRTTGKHVSPGCLQFTAPAWAQAYKDR